MKVPVYNQKGEVVGDIELNSKIFEVKPNMHLLAEAVRITQSNSRQGTANTKTRGEVRGGGKKPWKQKGTGRARVGSIRSPIWRHGGTVHGPQPRSYDYQFPRKKLLGALRSALAAKLSDGKLMVVEGFELNEAKTGTFRKTLGKLGVGKTTLLVDGAKDNRNLQLSSRNIPGVELVSGNHVHPYHLLRYETAIFSKPALEKLQDSLKATAPKRKAEV